MNQPIADRTQLLRDTVTIVMEAAHGLQKVSEPQLAQILSSLVKSKLLSAEDSYRLRDRLADTQAFDKVLERRIKRALIRKNRAA